MKCFFAFSLLATLAVTGYSASAQSDITENQGVYIYVDANTGSDNNSGVQNSPVKTIQAAINKANALNRSGIGVKVEIRPGVYREFVNVAGYNQTNATLTMEATIVGTAIVSGSDVLSGWNQDSNGYVYSRSWTYAFGDCAIPSGWPTNIAEIGRRKELIFVNGMPLTQVMSYADLQPGTFFVNDTYSIIHIDPLPGTDMSTAIVEAATRSQTLSVSKRSNVVIRGLVLHHAANCMNAAGAAINSSTNVLVDSVQAMWNNWGGFGIFSSNNVTVQNSIANYNGGVGFMGNQDQNILYNFNESDYNNWRGAQAAFYDWAMGGTKLFAMHGATITNHFSYNNQAQGLWFDTDNKNITISNATLAGNVQAALQIERNEGPITLQNSHLCSSGLGLNVLTSTKLTIQNNAFYNNGGANSGQAEIFVQGQAGGKFITDWQTGQIYDLFTTGMVMTGNTFQNATNGQLVFGTYLAGNDWTSFATTLKSSSNTWYDPTTPNSFRILNGKIVSLAAWQSAMGTDYDSTWQVPTSSPVTTCTPPPSAFADFNVNISNRTFTMTSGTAVATLRVNSFGSGPVTLQAKGIPPGVSASLSQQKLVSGIVTLTITSSKSAVAQTLPVTIYATSGSRVHSVTFYVQVIPI
jgi:hypothetical protein